MEMACFGKTNDSSYIPFGYINRFKGIRVNETSQLSPYIYKSYMKNVWAHVCGEYQSLHIVTSPQPESKIKSIFDVSSSKVEKDGNFENVLCEIMKEDCGDIFRLIETKQIDLYGDKARFVKHFRDIESFDRSLEPYDNDDSFGKVAGVGKLWKEIRGNSLLVTERIFGRNKE